MSEPEDYDRLYVVVVGGMNVDVKARSFHAPTPGASNPGTVTQAPGGVGRNIAETLARLGTVTHLVSALGNDDYGKWLLRETRHAGVRVDHVQVSEGRTGRFVAMLDNDGELVAGVADMSSASIVTPEVLESASLLIGSAAMLVLDANLPSDIFARAHRIALDSQVPVVVDPVSPAKAGRIRLGAKIHMLSPNLLELQTLVGRDVKTRDEVHMGIQELHRRGVEVVWLRLGEGGSLLSYRGNTLSLDAKVPEVKDTTGAGDSMTAGYCHALLNGKGVADSASYGQSIAAKVLQSMDTVPRDLGGMSDPGSRGSL